MLKVINPFNSATIAISKVLMATVKRNANDDISKGNKLIASNYISRALAKPTSGTNKENILNKITKEVESYIVMATSYTATDAMANTHAAVNSRSRKEKTVILIFMTLAIIISSVIIGSTGRAMMILIMTAIGIYTKRYEMAVSAISIIAPTTLSTKIIGVIELILEYYNLKHKVLDYTKAIISSLAILL